MRLREKTRWCISRGLSSNSKIWNKNKQQSFCETSHNSSADICCSFSHLSQLEMATTCRSFKVWGVAAFKRAISFFTSLSIDSDISSLNPEVWEKSVHLSGLSLATKTLRPGSSFWGQAVHLLMIWCYQSGSGNISFAWSSVQIKFGLSWVKMIAADTHLLWNHYTLSSDAEVGGETLRHKMQSHQLRSTCVWQTEWNT